MIRPLGWLALVLVAAQVPVTARAAAASPEHAQLAAIPFVSGLAAAPSGGHLAWTENAAGRRNLWIASPPAYEPRQVTRFDADDGQSLSQLAWSSDGRHIAFVRGNYANSGGWHSNPSSDPDPRTREVWLASTDGKPARRVAEGHGPVFEPGASRLAYVRGAAVYILDPGKPERRLLTTRGSLSEIRWAPSGARLAFVTERRGYSFVGVHDLARRTTTWMAPSTDWDISPRWSPDGKTLAFYRAWGHPETRGKDAVSLIIGLSGPMQVMLADPATGTARALLPEADPTGGLAQWEPDSLAWIDAGTILFVSERDGWQRGYALDVASSKQSPVTPAGCEAQDFFVDRRRLLFSANCDDLERRHVWEWSLSDRQARAITPGSGLEWTPVAVGDGLAYIASSTGQPPTVTLRVGAAAAPRGLNPAPTALSGALVGPETVRFRAADGLELTGHLLMPPGASGKGKVPAIVYAHGGPVRQMMPGWHPMEFYHHSYALMQALAARGYAVLYVNYRLGTGYGRRFRLAAQSGPFGASEEQDIVAAARYLSGRRDVDGGRIGIWGASYGGHLVGRALGRAGKWFRAGVSVCGLSNWETDEIRSLSPEERRRAEASSGAGVAATWRAPTLFIHGDDDRNVDFSQTVDMVSRLRRHGNREVDVLVFPDEDHFFLLHRSWLALGQASIEFFDRHLVRK